MVNAPKAAGRVRCDEVLLWVAVMDARAIVDNQLTAVDATSGARWWSVAMHGTPSGPAQLAAADGVLSVEDAGGITALDATTGSNGGRSRRWTTSSSSPSTTRRLFRVRTTEAGQACDTIIACPTARRQRRTDRAR